MATAAEAAIVELDAKVTLFVPRRDGLQEFLLEKLSPAAHAVVQDVLNRYDKRLSALVNARVALDTLMQDGHPDMPMLEVDPSVLAELATIAAKIEAALSQFESNAARIVGLTAGAVKPKV